MRVRCPGCHQAVPVGEPHPCTPEERLWAKVDKTVACWLWTGSTSQRGGYGYLSIENRVVRAHRLAYEVSVGPIPSGMHLHHTCGVPTCVNPEHLELLTAADHARHHRRARPSHCPRNHPYDEANTYVTQRGDRLCRVCDRDRKRAAHQRVRAARSVPSQGADRSLSSDSSRSPL